MKTGSRAVLLLTFLVVGTSAGYAQGVGASGDIRGTVTDPSGAVVPQATVVVVNADKGIRRTDVADAAGAYRVTGLPPAAYDVTAESRGFETQIRKGVVVTVGQTVIVDFQLQVSAMATEVVVTTETPLLEPEKTHQANTVSEQYIRGLPIDRRDYLTYTLLMPGVVDSDAFSDNTDFRVAQTPQSGISFYGSNGRGNNVTVDGSEANDDSGGVRLTLSQDAVQEFQINRSNYSTEYGGASGGVINIVSKSGTNKVHGSAFVFFRDDSLDARDPFAIGSALAPGDPFSLSAVGQPVDPPSDRQQFGGTIGFPIRKDKTFFFFGYEGLRRDESAAVPVLTDTSIFLPTAAQSGVFNGLVALGATPVPCLSVPLTVLPANVCAGVLGGLLTVDPTAAETPFAALSEPFLVNLFVNNSGIFPFTGRSDLFSARLDHQVNDNNQLFFRYNFGDTRERNSNLRALVGFSRGNLLEQFDSTIVAGWYRQFSHRAQNEARVMWNYYELDVTPNDPRGPELSLAGFGFFNRDIFLPSFTTGRRYEFTDNVTFITGRHKMKFGGYLLLRDNETESHTFFPGRFNLGPLPGGLVSPTFAGTDGIPGTSDDIPINALQAFKLGLPQFYQQGFDNPTVESVNPFTAFYWQDTWTPRPNLTLNFGLRYEFDKRFKPLRSDKNNFAPRFGFSWDPFNDRKTVMRGGYGIFYSPIYYQIDYVVRALGNVDGFLQIAQVFAPLTLPAPCLPLGVSTPTVPLSACIFQSLLIQGVIGCSAGSTGSCITPADLTQFGINITHNVDPVTGALPPLTVIFSGSDDYVNAYSQQGSFGIERELAPNFSISADYIFSRTLKITRARDKNIAPGGGFVNPLILQDNVYESTGRAFYHGFILSVNKRFSHHVSLFANYTLSKAIDEVTDFNSDFQPSDQTNLRAERSLSAFDQRHKLVIAGVLQSPWEGGPGAPTLERIFSDFTLSPIVRANSGRPFNLLAGADLNGDRHSTTDRPPFAGRNTGRGPDFWTFDLRVARNVGLGEERNLELIFEAFNLLNRLNFASVNNTVGVIGPPFNLKGRSDRSPSEPLGFTSAFPSRRIQLGLRFTF
ncbi:MAG: carboxypeptidase regulatory-like domain-containing protein [Terriglobia bacterium]